jgi:indole-3-glycerol phosphate synthase
MICTNILETKNGYKYLKITRFGEDTIIIFETETNLINYIINNANLQKFKFRSDNFQEICENVTKDNIHVYDDAIALYK